MSLIQKFKRWRQTRRMRKLSTQLSTAKANLVGIRTVFEPSPMLIGTANGVVRVWGCPDCEGRGYHWRLDERPDLGHKVFRKTLSACNRCDCTGVICG